MVGSSSGKRDGMNKTASILSLLIVGLCPYFSSTLRAQPAAPPFQKVLKEASVACKALAEREAKSENFAFDGHLSRGLLTYTLMRVGQRQAVDDLFSDESEKREIVATTEDLLVEVSGEVPEIAIDMEPIAELTRRQMIVMSLAKRGDFEKANEQIAEFPEHASTERFSLSSYKLVAEKQLEKQDLPGARKTIRMLWPLIRDIEDEDAQRKAGWIIKVAKLTSQAGEQAPAQKLCLMADEILSELRHSKAKERLELDDATSELDEAARDLAIAHAMSGNADRARALLTGCEQQAELIEDEKDRAQRMIALEEAYARLAEFSGQNDVALAAYGRALKWVKHIDQIDRDSPNVQEDQLELPEFVESLLSMVEGVDFRTIAVGQLKAGDKQAALETWEQMPYCIQKPATLLEMAKTLHQLGATAEAREMAERCARLDRPDSPAEDYVVITSFVANIYRAIGDDKTATVTLNKLAASPRVQTSPDSKKLAAAELIDFCMFQDAYSVIQTIETPADKALPLAKLAEGMAKSGHK